MKNQRRYLSAITGQFVTKAFAEQHPDTTVSETLEQKTIKPKKKSGNKGRGGHLGTLGRQTHKHLRPDSFR